MLTSFHPWYKTWQTWCWWNIDSAYKQQVSL
jgi:hypothetical protein